MRLVQMRLGWAGNGRGVDTGAIDPHSIRLAYRCLERILSNAVIQPFQQPERVIGFFSTYRHIYPVSRHVLREIANQYHSWVLNRSQKWQVEIQKDPEDRRDDFLAPCLRNAEPDQVVAIIKRPGKRRAS